MGPIAAILLNHYIYELRKSLASKHFEAPGGDSHKKQFGWGCDL